MWANEMTGAGFLSSPGNFGTQVGGSPKKKEKTSRSDNVVPCTVAQVLLTTTEKVMVGSLGVNNVSLLGMVRSVDEQSTRIAFQLDDMTGPPIEVQLWQGSDGEDKADSSMRSRIVENTYVRVVGNVRTIKDKKLLLAYKAMPVVDHNEVTMHILEVIHTGMAIALMDKAAVASDRTTLNQSTMNYSNASTIPVSGIGGGGSCAVNMVMENAGTHGMDAQQKMVFKVILDAVSQEGMHLDDICRSLSSIPQSKIRNAIDFLCNEGHIYSTVDDDHYKATDAI